MAFFSFAAAMILRISDSDLMKRKTVVRLVAHVEPEQYWNCCAAVRTEALADSPVLSDKMKMSTRSPGKQATPSPSSSSSSSSSKSSSSTVCESTTESKLSRSKRSKRQSLSAVAEVLCGLFPSKHLKPGQES